MPNHSNSLGFLKSKPAIILSAFLLGQAMVFYGFSRSEVLPEHTPLSQVPRQVDGWQMQRDNHIEEEIQKVLKADETLNRTYVKADSILPVHLFVAFFRSQRTGQAPHSPKNCLPGTGWVPSRAGTIEVPVEGREPIEVNRYVVAKGDNKSVVLYWYQSRDRVVASEYSAKFYVVADAIRYNRTDTALVRVVVPVLENDIAASENAAVAFVQSMFNPLRQHFPA